MPTFNLEGGNVAALVNNDLLHPTGESVVARTILVDANNIADVEPSIHNGLCGCFGISPIALHHQRTFDRHPTVLSMGQFFLSISIADGNGTARSRLSDGGALLVRLIAGLNGQRHG